MNECGSLPGEVGGDGLVEVGADLIADCIGVVEDEETDEGEGCTGSGGERKISSILFRLSIGKFGGGWLNPISFPFVLTVVVVVDVKGGNLKLVKWTGDDALLLALETFGELCADVFGVLDFEFKLKCEGNWLGNKLNVLSGPNTGDEDGVNSTPPGTTGWKPNWGGGLFIILCASSGSEKSLSADETGDTVWDCSADDGYG